MKKEARDELFEKIKVNMVMRLRGITRDEAIKAIADNSAAMESRDSQNEKAKKCRKTTRMASAKEIYNINHDFKLNDFGSWIEGGEDDD